MKEKLEIAFYALGILVMLYAILKVISRDVLHTIISRKYKEDIESEDRIKYLMQIKVFSSSTWEELQNNVNAFIESDGASILYQDLKFFQNNDGTLSCVFIYERTTSLNGTSFF